MVMKCTERLMVSRLRSEVGRLYICTHTNLHTDNIEAQMMTHITEHLEEAKGYDLILAPL